MKHPLVKFRDGEELVGVLQKIAADQVPRPCLLLLDLHMPLIDGFDVIRWLQARPEFTTLPVAVITSSPRESDRKRVAEAGVRDYFEKFPSEDDLTRVVAWASNHPFGGKGTN